MKFRTAFVAFSMLLFTAACSHEPTMKDEFADLALDNTGTVTSVSPSESVESAPMDLDLTPPADPRPAPRASRVRSYKAPKKHVSKKKLAKKKSRGKKKSELARSR